MASDRLSSSSLSLFEDSGYGSASLLQTPSTKNGDATQQNMMYPAHDQILSQRRQTRSTQILSQEQMNQVINDTNFGELLGSHSIEELFSKTEAFIIGRIHTTGLVMAKCAGDVTKALAYAEAKCQNNPEAFQEFRTRLAGIVYSTSNRTLDEWLELGGETRQRVCKWSDIICQNWACEVMDILPKQYATDKPLSVNILKGLADLSAMTSLDSGRKLLQEVIDDRKMPSKNGGRNYYETRLTLKDVTKALKQVQGNTEAVPEQARRTNTGANQKPTSKKRKREAPPTPGPSEASIPLTEETLERTPEKTPDPTQQDHPDKKSRGEAWWRPRWFPIHHQGDTPSTMPENERPDQHLAGYHSESFTVVQQTNALNDGSTVHQSIPVAHQQVDDIIDNNLVFHQDDSKRSPRARSQEPFPTEVQSFQSMSPELIRGDTMSFLPDGDFCLATTTISPVNQNPTLNSDIGSPSDQALTMAEAYPCGSEKLDKNRLRSITPLQRGNDSGSTPETCAHKTNDDKAVETRSMVSTSSYNEKSRLQGSSSLGSRILDSEIGPTSDQALRLAGAHLYRSENIDESSLRSIAPLQRGNNSDDTLGTCAHDNNNDKAVEARSIVSTSSYTEKARPQGPSSLETLKALSGPAMPTSDLPGAISSLHPRTWLSTTAIQLALEHCPATGVRIFDPSFLSSAPRTNLKPLSHGESILILPLQVKGNHWALIVVDTAKVAAEFWNSLPALEYENEAANAVRDFIGSLRNEVDRPFNDPTLTEWSLATQHCPRQDNTHDCGIYTIVFAMYRVLKRPIPEYIDSDLWRQVLSVLLDEGSELILNDQERHSTGGLTPSPTKRALGTSEFDDDLHQNFQLLIQSLHKSKRDLTSIEDIIGLSKEFQEQQRKLSERLANELQEVTQKVTFYKKVIKGFDEIGMSDDDKVLLDQTRRLLHKYDKTEEPKIQRELVRIQKALQGWARVTKACGKVYELWRGRVDEASNQIRRRQQSLLEVHGQFQDELTQKVS